MATQKLKSIEEVQAIIDACSLGQALNGAAKHRTSVELGRKYGWQFKGKKLCPACFTCLAPETDALENEKTTGAIALRTAADRMRW